jgi:hypothetical protein
MNLSIKERILLTTLVGIMQKLLDSVAANVNTGSPKRVRRTPEDAQKLRQQVAEARRKKIPVKQIARELGVTPSYIYQLGK